MAQYALGIDRSRKASSISLRASMSAQIIALNEASDAQRFKGSSVGRRKSTSIGSGSGSFLIWHRLLSSVIPAQQNRPSRPIDRTLLPNVTYPSHSLTHHHHPTIWQATPDAYVRPTRITVLDQHTTGNFLKPWEVLLCYHHGAAITVRWWGHVLQDRAYLPCLYPLSVL
jgi:hypothetical protein